MAIKREKINKKNLLTYCGISDPSKFFVKIFYQIVDNMTKIDV